MARDAGDEQRRGGSQECSRDGEKLGDRAPFALRLVDPDRQGGGQDEEGEDELEVEEAATEGGVA